MDYRQQTHTRHTQGSHDPAAGAERIQAPTTLNLI